MSSEGLPVSQVCSQLVCSQGMLVGVGSQDNGMSYGREDGGRRFL